MAVPSPEELLLAQLVKENQERPSVEEIAGLGALGGGAAGILAGVPVHAIGKGVGSLRGTNLMLKPGARMAGGLVGALVGGGLGAAAQQKAMTEAPAEAKLLAKIQARGEVSEMDKIVLENLLGKALSQQGIM